MTRAKRVTGAALQMVNPEPETGAVTILVGTPTLGKIRMEWHNAMSGLTAPPNWSTVKATPTGYTTGDAQNLLVDATVKGPFRALLLIEDDTIPPPQAYIEFDRWLWKMERKKAPPIISGVYHIKSSEERRVGKRGGIELMGPEPLIYRGSGSRAFRDFTYGDVVWCSGVPTGALLIHRSVLEAWVREPDIETYTLPVWDGSTITQHPLKRVFQNPSKVWTEPGGALRASSGTTDLWWSAETIKRDILTKAGWPQYAKKQYPFIVDTGLRFDHIDRASGRRW